MNRFFGGDSGSNGTDWYKELLSGDSRRLADLLTIPAPPIPADILIGLIRIRQAQSASNKRHGYWNQEEMGALWNAAEELVANPGEIAEKMAVNQLLGGGARTVVDNVDEMLLERVLNRYLLDRGDPHRMVSLFQQQTGLESLFLYQGAANLALLQGLEGLQEKLLELGEELECLSQRMQGQPALTKVQFLPLKIVQLGEEFSAAAEATRRVGRLLSEQIQILRPCWQGNQELLEMLRELSGVELLAADGTDPHVVQVDVYVGLAAFLRLTATLMLQHSQRVRERIAISGELDQPQLRMGPAFSPKAGELLVLDCVNLVAFDVIGSDAAINAAVNCTPTGIAAYFPLVTAKLVESLQRLTAATKILATEGIASLQANPENCRKWIAQSSLQAEKLVPLLGFERAAQVAKIAVLTEKPIKTVVVKMKMMTEEQVGELFAENFQFTNETE